MSTRSEHPNVERAREYVATFAAGDLDGLAGFLADDVVWRVGGYHPLSGEYRGRDAVVGYLKEANEASGARLALEPEAVLASDRHLAMFMRVTGERGDRRLDTRMAQVVKLDEDGRWREFWALSDDQPAIDAFWS